MAPSDEPAVLALPTRPFLAAGRPLQTSVALEEPLAERLTALARAASVPANRLLVAVLESGIPLESGLLRDWLVEDERAGRGVESNFRLPAQLRARMDALVGQMPAGARVRRAQLINAVLKRHLPDDAHAAAALVTGFERREAIARLAEQ